jgi:cell division protein FtsZ
MPRPAAPAPQAPPSGITIEPLAPAHAHYGMAELDAEEPMHAEEHHDEAVDAPYIPPAPEAPPQRIPRPQDFPPVAQRQIAANQPQAAAHGHGGEGDRGPMSLLRRLASVGLGRREEDPIGAGPVDHAPERQAPRATPPQQRLAQRVPQPQPQQRVAQPAPRQAAQGEALYRPRAGELDPHGRPAPRDARPAEDELEIPAFLRRQAN